MIRGSDDLLLLAPVTPSPEESVERRDTRRLGRDEDVTSAVAALLFLTGVAVMAAAAAADAPMDAPRPETDAAAEMAPAASDEDPVGCMRGKGSLVLTSLTPLSLLPLSLDFLVLPVAIPECG